jgi:hypothetical protein
LKHRINPNRYAIVKGALIRAWYRNGVALAQTATQRFRFHPVISVVESPPPPGFLVQAFARG